MKFNKYVILMVLPVAAMITSCGKKVAEGTSAESAKISSSVSSNSNSVNNPTPIPTVTPVAGCYHPIVAYAQPFSYTLTGTGNVTQTTSLGVVTADQDLRVQVTPNTDAGLNPYTKMAVTLTLLMDGNVVSGSSITVPNTTGTNGPKGGLAVGQKSAIVDFSSWLASGSHTYAVRVSAVNTDYTCNMYCNDTYYWNQCLMNYGYYYCYSNYANLVQSMTTSCKQMQCDVGPVTSGRGWSVNVKIETDNTPCLTP